MLYLGSWEIDCPENPPSNYHPGMEESPESSRGGSGKHSKRQQQQSRAIQRGLEKYCSHYSQFKDFSATQGAFYWTSCQCCIETEGIKSIMIFDFADLFWILGFPEGLHSNRIAHQSVCASAFKYLRDCSLIFSKLCMKFGIKKVKLLTWLEF